MKTKKYISSITDYFGAMQKWNIHFYGVKKHAFT
jgi:hypothetical protein